MKKSLFKTTLWGVAILAALTVIVAYWHHAKIYPSTDDAYVQANIIHIAPQVSGSISTIYIQNNQLIKKDRPLFDIDPAPFEIAVQAAQAKLDLTEQNVKALQDAITSAQALVTQRESEVTVATKNAKRILTLVKEGQEPKSTGDDITNQVNVAKANLKGAYSELAETQQKLGKTGNSNAQIRAAKAELNQAKLDLQHTHITAPADGKIVNFNARAGSMVAAGNPLFDIVEQSSWWIDANYKETQLDRIKINQPATISVDMYPDHTFTGQVESISAGSGSAFSILPPENATGNWVKVTQRIPVKVVITNTDNNFPLRVGASSIVTIDTTQ